MEQLVHPDAKSHSLTERWSVVVLYEDKRTRDRAMSLCDRLVKNFWAEVEFDFEWWRTDFLTDARMAQIASADATTADILIFSSSPEVDLSPVFLQWFRDWSQRREELEGMLLDLTDAASQGSPLVQRKQTKLRELARQANLEYFNRVPPRLNEAFANSWQDVEARTNQVTSVLDEILNRLPPPTHYGLNE